MNQRIKIFIVEYDCVNLITMMLWLDQYAEFDVLGTTVDTGNLRGQIRELKPDVVLLDVETPGPEDIPQLRDIKSTEPKPAVVLLYQGDASELQGILSDESDGAVGRNSTLGELYETVMQAYNRRHVIRSAALPVARAG